MNISGTEKKTTSSSTFSLCLTRHDTVMPKKMQARIKGTIKASRAMAGQG